MIRKWCRPVTAGCRETVADDDQGAGRFIHHGVAADLGGSEKRPVRETVRRDTRGARRRLWTFTPFRTRCSSFGAGDGTAQPARGRRDVRAVPRCGCRSYRRVPRADPSPSVDLLSFVELFPGTGGRRLDPGSKARRPGAILARAGPTTASSSSGRAGWSYLRKRRADRCVDAMVHSAQELSPPARGRQLSGLQVDRSWGAFSACAGPRRVDREVGATPACSGPTLRRPRP